MIKNLQESVERLMNGEMLLIEDYSLVVDIDLEISNVFNEQIEVVAEGSCYSVFVRGF